MKDICNLYLKRLGILRNRLCMALELLQGIPPSGVRALLLRSIHLLPFNPSLSLKDFSYDIDDAENHSINFKSAFIIYVQKIISSLMTIYKERSLQFHTDIELNLSMSLDDNDPAAKEEDDNFLFYILAPWQELWPEIINTELSCQEAADRLYNYIIQTAIPSIEIKDFLRVGNLYADITKIEAKGYRIDHDANKAIEITQEKVADLLGMKGLQKTSAIAPNAHPIVKACITYIEDLITLIDQLMDSPAKKTAQWIVWPLNWIHSCIMIGEYANFAEWVTVCFHMRNAQPGNCLALNIMRRWLVLIALCANLKIWL